LPISSGMATTASWERVEPWLAALLDCISAAERALATRRVAELGQFQVYCIVLDAANPLLGRGKLAQENARLYGRLPHRDGLREDAGEPQRDWARRPKGCGAGLEEHSENQLGQKPGTLEQRGDLSDRALRE